MLINPTPYSTEGYDAPLNDQPWPNQIPVKDMLVVVDADKFVYSAGFVCEHSEPIAYCPEGGIIGRWAGKARYNEWLKENPDVEHELDYIEWQDDVDMGNMILNGIRKQIRDDTNYARQKWYLTKGSSLWRNNYARVQPYKGNRTESRKPVYYDELRQYMKDTFGAKVLTTIEADDAVATMARERPGKVVVVSADKDLRTIPGYLLNPDKRGLGVQFISELEACRFLYGQMLMGDSADNIKGLSGTKGQPGWGPKKAEKAMLQFDNEQAMATFVAEQYKEKYPDGLWVDGGGFGEYMHWTEILVENANLLYLRRHEETAFTWEI